MNYTLIESNQKLNEIIQDFNSDYISIDTESNGLYVYYEKLCLVQIEFNGNIFIIDPFKADISILEKIFENPDIEKIFHSAYSDISTLKKVKEFKFKNIFDIMIATKYIFKKPVSLSNLVKKYFNIELDKRYQKLNWGKRPLSDDSLRYASMDVIYLKRLRDIFFKNLIDADCYEEFKYTCNKLSNVLPKVTRFNRDKYVSMAKRYNLQEFGYYVFIKLVEERENIAKHRNIPPFRVITNELLIEIAKNYDEILNAKDLSLYNRCIVRNIDWIKNTIRNVIRTEVNENTFINKKDL
jgi:ribonuclease D